MRTHTIYGQLRMAVIATLFVLIATPCWCQQSEGTPIKLSDLAQKVKGGTIDWGGKMMYASGEGIMPTADKEPNRARAYLKARDYAKMAAIANLFIVVEGTTITYEGDGKDMMAQDATLKQTITGYVKNVEILNSERVTVGSDTIVKVTVGTRIYGEATPGSAFLEKLAQTEKPKQPPLIHIPEEKSGPKPSIPAKLAESQADRWPFPAWTGIAASRPVDPDAPVPAAKQKGPFSSLVVDCRGYVVPQALSPKIRKLNGDQVYVTIVSKTDPALKDGTVSYARTPENARENERCGANPLLVKVIGRGGGRAMCDVIVSDEAAKLIGEENNTSKFLDQRSVIFVVDPPGSALSSSVF